LVLFVLDNFEDFAARAQQLPSLGEQPGVLGEVGDELLHVVTFHLEAQGPDGGRSLPLLLAVEVHGLLRANRQLSCDPGKTAAREGLASQARIESHLHGRNSWTCPFCIF
jgi:hypothetical protein